MDRDNKADDNAEHFYRYLMSIGQTQNVYFLLCPQSPDWSRLKAEGFHLIEFNSREHHAALLNAELLISSHADLALLWPLPREEIENLVNYRFVFLQHGVIYNDLSRWLNTLDIACFVTSTPKERQSIAGLCSNYRLSEKEVVLTGLARHDALWKRKRSAKTILIAPTWRRYLLTEREGQPKREPIDNFGASSYATHWKSVLHSSVLHEIATKHNLQIIFYPHPEMAVYLDEFKVPEQVEVKNPLLEADSIQKLFAQSALLITDYSSIALEIAYLEKPVIYFQFDIDQFYAGGHVIRGGYLDSIKDGFGPVCTTEFELLTQLESILSGHVGPKFRNKSRATFPYKDGKCCERIYHAIQALS